MGGGFGGFDAGGGAVGGGFNMGGGGGGGIDFDAGTPAPDFSPDTRSPISGNDGKKGKGGGGGQSPAVVAGAAIAALLIGIVATSLFLNPYIPEMINPTLAAKNAAEKEVATAKQQVQSANAAKAAAEAKLAEMTAVQTGGGDVDVTKQLSETQAELERVSGELETKTADLQAIERDVLAKNEEFLGAQQLFEDLKNETAITQARQKGLLAEIERLTTYVGELDDANARRIQTRDSLAHAVDRLVIQIQEGIPLTPEKYSHRDRVLAAQALRDQIEASNWVSPEIQEGYNKLYLRELELAQGNEYFFAKLRVTDEFGNKSSMWAECLMQGNWSVIYRTLDGKNIGEYTNLAPAGEQVRWGFREDLPQDVKAQLEQKVFASRVEGFEEKIAVIAAKQLATQEDTAFQEAFSSL
jgi:flagellar motility protein MotE (MotC chaperone)